MKTLDLSDSPWTLAYDRIVLALKNDPTLSATITPNGWRTYTDEPDNDTPAGEDTLPAIEILPFGLGASSEAPISQYAPLGIGINVATEGLDVRDLMNLWYAIHAAIFPGDGSRTLVSAIRGDFVAAANGAQLESIQLTMPAITPAGPALGKQIMMASGSLSLTIRVRK
jgi:hypothetical protein